MRNLAKLRKKRIDLYLKRYRRREYKPYRGFPELLTARYKFMPKPAFRRITAAKIPNATKVLKGRKGLLFFWLKLMSRLRRAKFNKARILRMFRRLRLVRLPKRTGYRYFNLRNFARLIKEYRARQARLRKKRRKNKIKTGKPFKPFFKILKPFRKWKQTQILQKVLDENQAKRGWYRPQKVRTIWQVLKYKPKPKLRARIFRRTLFHVAWKEARRRRWFHSFHRRLKRSLPHDNSSFDTGIIYITFKHNNTFMTLLDGKDQSKVLYVNNAGMVGFKGPKRGTVVAREQVAVDMSATAAEMNIKMVDIYFNLVGRVYWYIIKGLHANDIHVRSMTMKRPKAHGYIRPKKERRV